jgi:hypothetical protein
MSVVRGGGLRGVYDGGVRVDVESDNLPGCPWIVVGHGRLVQVLHEVSCFGRPVRATLWPEE